MGSFIKFVLFVTATSFACTALLYEPLMGPVYGDPYPCQMAYNVSDHWGYLLCPHGCSALHR